MHIAPSHRWRRLALVDPHDGCDVILEGFPYMDSALSASSFLKCSFVPTTSGLRYREKGCLIQSIFHFLSLKTLVNRRGTLGFLSLKLSNMPFILYNYMQCIFWSDSVTFFWWKTHVLFMWSRAKCHFLFIITAFSLAITLATLTATLIANLDAFTVSSGVKLGSF